MTDHGTVQVGVIAFSDNSGDGLWDPREYIAYVPDGFEGKELPVLVLYPGNSQTDSIFMDSTLWWQVADKEGSCWLSVCETYSASPSSVSHADSDKFYNSLMAVLEETIDGTYANLDFSRWAWRRLRSHPPPPRLRRTPVIGTMWGSRSFCLRKKLRADAQHQVLRSVSMDRPGESSSSTTLAMW